MMFDSVATTFAQPETCKHAALHRCAHEEVSPAENVEFPLDSDVLDALHAMGDDWETHFNAILRKWLRSNPVLS
ncbi:MAG: BrnA antitoxin family protein [Azoarcus sp.]|nr:BrnA antitoxin family protein [Azoarcus sp.]